VEDPLIAYGVLVFSACLEGLALRAVLKEAKTFKPKGQNWLQFIKRSKSVNHIVLAMEDISALTGLSFAFIGITLSLITKNGIWDGFGTLAIGLLLVVVAFILFTEVKSLLIGEGADEATLNRIREEVDKVEIVESIVDLKTLWVGPAELFIAMKIVVDHDDTARLIAEAIDEVEARIRSAVPEAKLIYVEPDLYKSKQEQAEDDAELQELLENE